VTAASEVEVLIIGPREFAAMANIPGFRNALFKSMAGRLRAADARIAEYEEGDQLAELQEHGTIA
jgi:CRP-like cAMP-binding protein